MEGPAVFCRVARLAQRYQGPAGLKAGIASDSKSSPIPAVGAVCAEIANKGGNGSPDYEQWFFLCFPDGIYLQLELFSPCCPNKAPRTRNDPSPAARMALNLLNTVIF